MKETPDTMALKFERNHLIETDSESDSENSKAEIEIEEADDSSQASHSNSFSPNHTDVINDSSDDSIQASHLKSFGPTPAHTDVINDLSDDSSQASTSNPSSPAQIDVIHDSFNVSRNSNKINNHTMLTIDETLNDTSLHDNGKEIEIEDNSIKEDSFKKFLSSKKKNPLTSSSPYEPSTRKGIGKNDNERSSIDSDRLLTLDSGISTGCDLEIIDDSYNQFHVSNGKVLNNDLVKNKGALLCIEESESEISDASSINGSSLKSFPSNSIGSIGSTSSDKSLSTSNLSNSSQNSFRRNISGSESEKSIVEGQIRNKTVAYQNLLRAGRSCDPRKLKDGGKLLEEKIKTCKVELDELKQKLQELTDTEIEQDSIEVVKIVEPNPLFSTRDQVTANLGKKGLETHRIQSALTVDALVTLHDSLKTCPTPDTFETDPKGLKAELMPHQKHALAWLLWREGQTPRGGILADDMGLGKTLTMISLILKSEEYKGDREDHRQVQKTPDGDTIYPGKTLVVCPASLVGQWESQVKQHCKKNILNVLIHHGKPRELQAKRLAKYDLVITTYGIIAEENKMIEEKNRKGALFRVNWERVILDEAHVIRNHKTLKAVALFEIESKFKWCLTGTPVHNKELDMFSLLKFLKCSPFDDLAVWKRWVDNKSANGVQRLNTVVKSILLRRTKEDLKVLGELKDLPNKDTKTVYIELDENEMKVYHEVLRFSKTLVAQYIFQKEEKAGFLQERMAQARSNLKNMDNIQTSEIFVLLLRLRQICCLPGLIHSMLEKDTCADDGIEAETAIMEDLITQVKRLSVGNPDSSSKKEEAEKVLVDSNPVFNMKRPSKKIQTVLEIVEEILHTDDKVVIVSQWATLLRLLESHLRRLKVGIVTLDGSVPVKSRTKIVEDFNNSKTNVRIMLLSLNAGGVGLNLIGGNRLIIFEPHWNPQLESQACDRIYRVGQKKTVQIYKIICKDTIEERIEQLQKKKIELADNVLKGELKKQVSKLSLQDLMVLFDFGQPGQPPKF